MRGAPGSLAWCRRMPPAPARPAGELAGHARQARDQRDEIPRRGRLDRPVQAHPGRPSVTPGSVARTRILGFTSAWKNHGLHTGLEERVPEGIGTTDARAWKSPGRSSKPSKTQVWNRALGCPGRRAGPACPARVDRQRTACSKDPQGRGICAGQTWCAGLTGVAAPVPGPPRRLFSRLAPRASAARARGTPRHVRLVPRHR